MIEKRASRRFQMTLRGSITWRDRMGVVQSALVVTRDVSEYGAFVEILGRPREIPPCRMVTLEIDPTSMRNPDLALLRERKLLSLVYRSGPARGHAAGGYALRLLVEPRREAVAQVA